jgi:hypothetical protein
MDVSKPLRWLVLLAIVGCDAPPKADASRTASEKWAEPKAPAEAEAEGDDAKKADAKAGDAKAPAEPEEEGAEAEVAAVLDVGAAVLDVGGGEVVEAPTLPPGDPGPAFFAVDDKGVFAIDGGTVTAIKKGPETLVHQMLVGPDGKPYLLAHEGVMRIEDGTAKMIAKTSFKTTGSVDAFAIAADGHVWTAGFKGVAHWDGKAWTLDDKTKLGAEVKLLKGIAIAKDGKVWVASSNALHVKDGDAWKEVDLGPAKDRRPFFDMVVAHPVTGAIHAAASTIVLEATAIDAVKEMPLASQPVSSFGKIAFAQNGIGVLETDPKHVARLVEGATTTFERGKDFTGTRAHHIAVDGQGRVWVATDAGIAVLGPATERVEWKTGSIPELAGKVKAMLIVGAGPQLPEVGEVKKGTIKGKILIDGAPLADADIEMCPEPATLIKKSPCEDSPVKFAGKTAADGAFEFQSTPLGAYGIAVRVGDKWKTTLSGQYGAKMKENETHDIGALKFKK